MTPDRLRPNEREVLYAPDRRMNAYYYSFDPTGQPAIDAILSAVAHAGKGYHHTESWHDDGEWSRWGEGRSVVDVIQAAANEAALALLDAAEGRDILAATVGRVRALHRRETRWGNEDYSIDAEEYAERKAENDEVDAGWALDSLAAFDVCAECCRIEQSIEQRDDGVAVLEGLWPCPTVRALGAEHPAGAAITIATL